jgi:hypothetical protein
MSDGVWRLFDDDAVSALADPAVPSKFGSVYLLAYQRRSAAPPRSKP